MIINQFTNYLLLIFFFSLKNKKLVEIFNIFALFILEAYLRKEELQPNCRNYLIRSKVAYYLKEVISGLVEMGFFEKYYLKICFL